MNNQPDPNNQPPNTSPNNNNQTISESEKSLPTPSSHTYKLIIAILLLLLLATSSLTAYFYRNPHPTDTAPNTANSPSPTLQPSEASAKEATTTWQTYTNQKYNFSIQYKIPEDPDCQRPPHQATNSNNTFIISPGNPCANYFAVTIENNPQNLTPQDFWRQQFENPVTCSHNSTCTREFQFEGDTYQEVTNLESITLANQPALKTTIQETLGVVIGPSIYLPHNQRIYIITYTPSETTQHMLSTFQFLPDTSNWQTYTNEKYGYSISYPNNQNLKEGCAGISTAACSGDFLSGFNLQPNNQKLNTTESLSSAVVFEMNPVNNWLSNTCPTSRFVADLPENTVHTESKLEELTLTTMEYYSGGYGNNKFFYNLATANPINKSDDLKEQVDCFIFHYRMPEDQMSKYKATFDQILSTFKLTN